MITKEFLERHFNHHDSITLWSKDNIKLTISKAYHFHLTGGHRDFDIHDTEDLASLCERYGLSLESHETL